MAVAALFAYGVQELTKVLFGGRGSPLLSAFLVGVAANLYARFSGKVPATFVIPGLLQLAPGFIGSQAIFKLIAGHPSAGAEEVRLFDVFVLALQLVTGLFIADMISGRAVRARFERAPAPSH
jgi:uncharacterized membrane protein YjjB (DUF3815 family)